MAVLNDFALNGGIVPSHSRTGRPRTLCGGISSNEQFNHYIHSSRTDNLKKNKKNAFWMKGFTTISLCCRANTGHRGRWKSKAAFFTFSVGSSCFSKTEDQKCALLAETQGHCWCPWWLAAYVAPHTLRPVSSRDCCSSDTQSKASHGCYRDNGFKSHWLYIPSFSFCCQTRGEGRVHDLDGSPVADDVAFRNDVANPIRHAFSIYRQKQRSVMSWNIARWLMCIIVMHYLFLHECSSQ